jgi:hypothetical protein
VSDLKAHDIPALNRVSTTPVGDQGFCQATEENAEDRSALLIDWRNQPGEIFHLQEELFWCVLRHINISLIAQLMAVFIRTRKIHHNNREKTKSTEEWITAFVSFVVL